jgi:hypothetical protein
MRNLPGNRFHCEIETNGYVKNTEPARDRHMLAVAMS